MFKGKVKWFDSKKGFGFITNEEGTDIFVHFTGLVGKGFKSIEEGKDVTFDVKNSEKGPQAVNVKTVA